MSTGAPSSVEPSDLERRSRTEGLALGPPTPDGIQRFIEAFGAARSAADFYRCRSLLTRLGTPYEVVALPRLLGPLPRPERRWLKDQNSVLGIEGHDVRRFDRLIVHEDIVLYRVAEAPRSTTILVAYMGRQERLMLDTPTFLQHLPDDTDVLVIRDVLKRGHLMGIPGIADDLAGVVAAVREAVVHAYSRILTIGTSMGGAAALHAAVLLGAERGVSVGGFPIDPVSVIGPLSASPERHVPPSASPEGDGRPQLVCVFGAENAKDRTGAERFADVMPIDARLAVAGVKSHGVLDKARQFGKLRELLTLLLNEHISAGSHAWTGVVVTPRAEAEPSVRSSSKKRRMPAALHYFSRAARRGRRTATELLVRIHLRTPMSRSIRLRISHAAYRRFGLILPETSRRDRKHGAVGTGS